MQLTVQEMTMLCVFHAGTRSATLDLLREAENNENETPERMATIKSVIEKLSGAEDGGAVSLAFEPEK